MIDWTPLIYQTDTGDWKGHLGQHACNGRYHLGPFNLHIFSKAYVSYIIFKVWHVQIFEKIIIKITKISHRVYLFDVV